jgi:hypothetical protein
LPLANSASVVIIADWSVLMYASLVKYILLVEMRSMVNS